MIVYFWEKSKKQYRKWGILTFVVLVELYLGYVWSNILLRQTSTLQLKRSETASFSILVGVEPVLAENVQLSENPYVASKKGKYYYPSNCSKAKALSVKNMLYYKDKMSAEAAGYKEYLQCK